MTHSLRDPLTHEIIGAAIEVHRHLGPGILESAFEECLCFELAERDLSVKRQIGLPLIYKGHKLEIGYRPDLVIADQVIVELKSVEKLLRVHDAQLLTYLKLSGLETGLLINIQAQPLIDGVKRMVKTNSAASAVSAVSASTSAYDIGETSRANESALE